MEKALRLSWCLRRVLFFLVSGWLVLAATTSPAAAQPCNYVETNGNNCYFHTATAAAAGTVQPTLQPTAIPGTTTPTPLRFFPTPTALTASTTCPAGAWDASNLDPSWSLACRHCLPSQPTRTPNVYVPEFQMSAPIFGTVQFQTFTPPPPTPTSTATLTPTPTGTITPTFEHVFDFVYGDQGWANPPGYEGFGLFSSGWWQSSHVSTSGQGHTTYEEYLHVWRTVPNGSVTITYVGALIDFQGGYYNANPGTIDAIFYALRSGSGVLTIRQGVNATPQSFGWLEWTGSAAVNAVGFYAWAEHAQDQTNPAATARLYKYIVRGIGNDPWDAPPPTHTPTMTPTPTQLPPATGTPSFGAGFLIANCQVPIYVDRSPAAEMGVDFVGTSCYRLVPQIDVNLVGIQVQTQGVDFCFDFYEPTLVLLGIVIDLQLFISLSFALFLVRWGLFN